MKNHDLSGGIFSGLRRALPFLAFAAAALPGLRADSSTYNFVTLAGNAAALDHTDGTGTNARFLNPVAVATDASGNVYVADSGDHTIRKVSAGGAVTTLAGLSGQIGSADGQGGAARFNQPYALAVDAAGTVYVADLGDSTIRKVTAGGAVTTLAGTAGIAGSADGQGGAAAFNGPEGIAVDAAGNVYVSDTNNSTIRKITPTGGVTTLAGSAGQTGGADGATNSARFNYPAGLAIDTAGNLYVADFANSDIRKVTGTGTVTTIAGTAGTPGKLDGSGAAARFDHPNAVAVDAAGNVYVIDTSNQTVRMITVAGVVSTIAGNPGIGGHANGTGIAATFFYPQGIASTAAGAIYVADTGNHSIRATTSAGSVTTLAGGVGVIGSADGTGTSATFNYPYGVAVDSAGNAYVADQNNNTIRKITAGGAVTTLAGTAGITGSANGSGSAASFNGPTGVAVDAAGNVYVADAGNATIRKITAAGAVTTLAGTAGVTGAANGAGAAASFNHPEGIAVNSAGTVYVADTNNNVIRQITAGVVSTLAGTGQTGSGDGPGGGASFNRPAAVAVDGTGNLYVADFGNGTIRTVTAAGIVATLAGTTGLVGNVDGTGAAARFNQTYSIAADSVGNVYVTDALNRSVRKVTPAGAVTTLNGTINGVPPVVRFFYPQGIAVDGTGKLYVVDGDNQSISVGVPVGFSAPGALQVGNHTVAVGQATAFTFGSPAAGTTYQWQLSTNGGATWNPTTNGATYAGSTTTSLAIASPTAGMNGFQYRLVMTLGATVTTTNAGTLYVGNVRLVNLSSRAPVGVGQANALVAGVVITGSGSKQLLVRGIGPTLAQFQISNPLATPSLTLFNGAGGTLASDTVWGGGATLTNAFASLGAFALPAASADSALYLPVAVAGSSNFTAQVSGVANATGEALVELYDGDTGTPATRMVNISTRANVGTGGNVLIVGFVIGGTTSETVLIRGIGPGLVGFGFASSVVLANPVVTLFDGTGAPITSNTVWNGTTALIDASASTGAFALSPSSVDSELLLSLPPGNYTAQLSGTNSGTGVGLLEIYEVH